VVVVRGRFAMIVMQADADSVDRANYSSR
jgi:hypothetical protein